MKNTKVLGVVIAAVIVALSFILPEVEGLTRQGIGSLCVLLAILILLLTDAVPVIVGVLMGPALLIFLRITSPPGAHSNFGRSAGRVGDSRRHQPCHSAAGYGIYRN